jgi:hypothetical protein
MLDTKEMSADGKQPIIGVAKKMEHAHQVATKLKLPFLVYPGAITETSHHLIRFLRQDQRMSRCLLKEGEFYADVNKQGNLRLWSLSVWSSPIIEYRMIWKWARTKFNEALTVGKNTPLSQSIFQTRPLDENDLFKLAVLALPFELSPMGLSVYNTDIEWPVMKD